MVNYKLSLINNTKTGRACFGLLMVPAFFLGWITFFHFNEYEQLTPIWFLLPLLLLGFISLLNINITSKNNEIITYLSLARFTIESTVKSYAIIQGDLFYTKKTKIKGEHQLMYGPQAVDVNLIGNIEKHVIILNAFFINNEIKD